MIEDMHYNFIFVAVHLSIILNERIMLKEKQKIYEKPLPMIFRLFFELNFLFCRHN